MQLLAAVLVALVLGVTSHAVAAPVVVQNKSAFTGGASSTPAVTMDSGLSAGNLYLLGVFIIGSTTTNLSSVSGCGETWTVVTTLHGTTDSLGVAYAPNGTGGCSTITATLSAGNNASLFAYEVSGIATSTPAEGSAPFCNETVAPGSGTDAIVTPSITTATAGDFIWGMFIADAAGLTAGTGYTNIDLTGGGNTAGAEYLIQSAAGAITATATGTAGSNHYPGCILAFKASSGGGGAPPRRRGRIL